MENVNNSKRNHIISIITEKLKHYFQRRASISVVVYCCCIIELKKNGVSVMRANHDYKLHYHGNINKLF